MVKPATTITLRARKLDVPLVVGDFVRRSAGGAPQRSTVYRVVSVTRVSVAGEPKKNFHRLVLERLSAAHIPEGAVVIRLGRDPRSPRRARPPASSSADPGRPEAASARIARIRSKAPLLLEMAVEAIRKGRVSDEMARLARAARVGRDDGKLADRDYGPGIRLKAVHSRRRSELLREADVEIGSGADPEKPNVTVSRARRCDPLVKLHKAGSLAGRHIDAAEKLRMQLEAADAGGSGGELSEIHLPAHQRHGISDWQLLNSTHVRRAVNAVASDNRSVLLWAVSGGNVSGFASYVGMRHTTASQRLRSGLGELADHYGLTGRTT